MRTSDYTTNPVPTWSKKLKILVVPPNEGGCAYYRSIMPMQKLAQHYPNHVDIRFDKNPLGLDLDTKQLDPNFKRESLEWADVVMVNNISNFGGHYTAMLVKTAKEMGKFVHYDTDDLLTDLYEEHRLYDVYKNGGLSELTKYVYSMSDLVTVTQRKFAERIAPFCSKILAVVKNAIDYDLPCWNYQKASHGSRVHIGWAGGIHHRPDVLEFASVPHIVNQKVGRENVFWDFYGRPKIDMSKEEDRWQSEAWDEYQRALLKGFKGQRNWAVHPALPPDQYGVFYANMDLAIAPLKMNNFNDSKSEIKVAECGRYRVPLICSDVGCYDETIINGQTGIIIPVGASKAVWCKKISELVRDPKKIKEMGNNLRETTEKYFNINKVVGLRLSLYDLAFKELSYDPFLSNETKAES